MWIKNLSKVSVYLPLSLCLLYACDDSDDTESTSGGMQMAGEEAQAGSETMSGDEVIAGESMAGEIMAGDEMMAGEEDGPSCIACESDEDCERGQSCVAMDNNEMIKFCFAPCFDDGTCAEDGQQCSTLSHDLGLYVCSASSCDFCYDLDGDGYGMGPGCLAADCNDDNDQINRGMLDDVCDGVDNDCNGLVDDGYLGVCPAPNWRVVNETNLEDRWAIYEMTYYGDDECSNSLHNLIEIPFSSVEDEELESFLLDLVVNPVEALPWLGGVLEEALANASFAGYMFNGPVEVKCVDLYQSLEVSQRQSSIRLQSGFNGEWSSNTLMIGIEQEDRNGFSFTRFVPSSCGDGLVAPNEECDTEALYCMNCEITYAAENEVCMMAEQETALCEEGFVCISMEGEGLCLPPQILIEEEECEPDDQTAICGDGLRCIEGNNGFVCSQE